MKIRTESKIYQSSWKSKIKLIFEKNHFEKVIFQLNHEKEKI